MSTLLVAVSHQYPTGFKLRVEIEFQSEVTALVGPSGSGKSSVLGIASGLLRPTAGCVQLDGTKLVDTARAVFIRPAHRGLAIVAQEPLLFAHLTVAQNLQYGARRRSSSPGLDVSADEVIESLELAELSNRPAAQLSGGQAQRVALGRALLSRPRWLLLDEPVSALETELRSRVLDFVQRVTAASGVPIILASHQLTDVQRLASRVVRLEDGRVVEG